MLYPTTCFCNLGMMIAIWVFAFPIFRETHFRFPVDPRGPQQPGEWRQRLCFWKLRQEGAPAPVVDDLPSGNLLRSYWKWTLIVDFPIKNSDFHSYVNVYQRVKPSE